MKSKKTNPFVITTLIFFMTTVMFGLLTTGVIIKYRKSTVATNTDKLSNDEIEKLKSEEKEDLLSDMKLRFTNGEGSLSILKSYFPDNIVYVNTGKVFLGIAICIVVNFCILIMSFAYQFVIYLSITDENLLFMLDIYTYIVNIIGMIYLYKMIDKKELIKQCIT